ncbi:sensor domain-containing diguanylate cyclase [Thiogranum longum]|jgi:diguanylate cyclase
MDSKTTSLEEFHWLMDMIQTIDVGLVVIDRKYNVSVWNSFMQNHSGKPPHDVIGRNLFKLFSDIPEDWFRRKAESVFLLNNRAFTTWEQRPYLIKFKNYRPITGTAEFMYQNMTLIPLVSTDGAVNHVGVIIYDVTDMAVSKDQLENANSQLETLSRTDRLTELNNRGFWEECLISEFRRSKRTKQPSTLVMFDIDHFKKVNDSYGHQAGDEVIRNTAAILKQCARETDIAGRYGGEEFGVILIDTSASNALLFAERLRKTIEAQTVTHEGRDIAYTVSLGVAELTDDIKNHKQWIECSDQALYEAKHGGRNQAATYSAAKKAPQQAG